MQRKLNMTAEFASKALSQSPFGSEESEFGINLSIMTIIKISKNINRRNMENYELTFSSRDIKKYTHLPFSVMVTKTDKDIWKISPEDLLNDQEHESEYWNCKFLLAAIHDVTIMNAIKQGIKKYSARPEESFIKVTDAEKIFSYEFFLRAANLKELKKLLLDFYTEVNSNLQKSAEETAKLFEQL